MSALIAAFGFIIRFWITIILLHLFVYLPMLTRTLRISHALPTPAATAPSTAAATPTAPAASGKFQHYQCGRRMSNLIYDHHSVCFVCMGFDGTWHCCGEWFFYF